VIAARGLTPGVSLLPYPVRGWPQWRDVRAHGCLAVTGGVRRHEGAGILRLVVKLRHYLNDKLRIDGEHVGYYPK
jgi:hypothetical protein